MDTAEYLKRYFEQLRGNKQITSQDIKDAIAFSGEPPTSVLEVILAHAKAQGVNPEKELADLYVARASAQAEKVEQKHRADIKTSIETNIKTLQSLTETIESAPINKISELLSSISADIAGVTITDMPKIITSKELMVKVFPPRQWTIENLIEPGLTILSGAPKIGKSWLLFALAEAASTGGNFLDKYKVNKTPILHLSLEDTERSIQERRVMLRTKQGGFTGNDNLVIATEWENGPEGLAAYLQEHREIKLVIIDTLGAFMPDIEDMNDYAATVKAIRKIKKIADTLNIAILIVHHAKKGSSESKGDWMDQSLGSTGIVGSADTIILLQRDIENKTNHWTDKNGKEHYKTVSTGNRLNTGKFHATGRSIKDIFHEVEFFPGFGMWAVTNDKESSPKQDENDDGNGGITAESVGAKKRR
jgi:hypothetical protein